MSIEVHKLEVLLADVDEACDWQQTSTSSFKLSRSIIAYMPPSALLLQMAVTRILSLRRSFRYSHKRLDSHLPPFVIREETGTCLQAKCFLTILLPNFLDHP